MLVAQQRTATLVAWTMLLRVHLTESLSTYLILPSVAITTVTSTPMPPVVFKYCYALLVLVAIHVIVWRM